MTELILHMNNYSITGVITAYQTYPANWNSNLLPNVRVPRNLNYLKIEFGKLKFQKESR